MKTLYFEGAGWSGADIGLRMLTPRELYRANLPEWCGKAIATMAEFEKEVAV